MWALDNQTPYSAERTFVRDGDGAEIWLVAIRATFDLFPDGSWRIAKKQLPVAQAPEYLGRPGYSSLRWDSDLQRTKMATDILVNATAYVPKAAPDQKELRVGVRVGSMVKELSVWGDRVWERSLGILVPSQPVPFRSMPIVYERAFGGASDGTTPKSAYQHCQRNPIGVGVIKKEGLPLPNIAASGRLPEQSTSGSTIPGLGAVGCSWTPRRELAGTYDKVWKETRQPLVPSDFDDRYFQSAPHDQISDEYLKGGERVELMNLTPNGRLRFELPKLRFGFRTWIGGATEHHRANLHTLIIEPDAGRFVMVWHTALPCHHTLYTLKRTVVFEKKQKDFRRIAA